MNWRELFRRKSVQELMDTAHDEEGKKLNKVLTARDIFNAGVACIIGTGIFVIAGVAAHDHAGPAVIISFLIAGLVAALVNFSYAEMGGMIPISGSAYTYAYATQGELLAWIIGWDLLFEYPVGSGAVASGWSAYGQSLLSGFGIHLPPSLSHAPTTVPWLSLLLTIGLLVGGLIAAGKAKNAVQASGFAMRSTKAMTAVTVVLLGAWAYMAFSASHVQQLCWSSTGCVEAHLYNLHDLIGQFSSIDLLAIAIVGFLNIFLLTGIKATAKLTGVFVIIKLIVIAAFIGLGIWYINPANFHPFLHPDFGWSGVFTGASIVFFAYIGADVCTTYAEECKNPQQDVPRGMLASLALCTALYIVVATIMVGDMSYTMLGGSEAAAPMARVLAYIGDSWAVPLIAVGAMAGITSVLMVLLLGQSRIMMRMSRDGLLPPVLGKVSAKTGTPALALTICGIATALMAGTMPIGELAELTNIGTLAAFVVVCIGVIVLRKVEPDRIRKFVCPGYPYVPIAGALLSAWMIFELPWITQIRFVVCMAVGLVVYFMYGRKHSLIRNRTSKPDEKSGQPPAPPSS